MSGSQELFEIESVLDHRKTARGKDEFYVKWLDYDHSHNSWEPGANLSNEIKETYFERKKYEDVISLKMYPKYQETFEKRRKMMMKRLREKTHGERPNEQNGPAEKSESEASNPEVNNSKNVTPRENSES